jgi:uncharacterized YccA/Bax inhibitor family protein
LISCRPLTTDVEVEERTTVVATVVMVVSTVDAVVAAALSALAAAMVATVVVTSGVLVVGITIFTEKQEIIRKPA